MDNRVMFVCALLIPACLCGQETRGMIYGRVVDPQSSAVSGVGVIVTNTETNVSANTTTNDTGYYSANLLVAGDYRVTVATPGFKQLVRPGIRLSMGGQVEINFQLELGVVTESISVGAEQPLLDTVSASSGRVVDERNMRDLPMIGNQPTLLVVMVAGMNDPGYATYSVPGYNNGNSRFYTVGNIGGNDYSIDGAPNPGIARAIGFVPLSDSVSEFRVETSNFDPTVGHTVGASVAMMTKAGTNALHGAASDMFNNERWNAPSFFARQLYYQNLAQAQSQGAAAVAAVKAAGAAPPGHGNRYQASLGGPVYLPKVIDGRNRLFFFVSYSGLRDRKSTASGLQLFTVPTTPERGGNFSDLLKVTNPAQYQIYDPLTVISDPARSGHYIRSAFPGNIIPASRIINPTYNAYLKLLPLDNNNPMDPSQQPVNNLNNARGPWNLNYNAVVNRIDYQALNQHRFFGRWSWNNFLEDQNDWTWSTARGLHSSMLKRPNLSATADWVYTPGAKTVLDVTVSSSAFLQGNDKQVPESYKPSDVGLPTYMDQFAGQYHTLPSMSFDGYQAFSTAAPLWTHTRQLTAKADLSQVRGRHSVKAGVDQRQYTRTDTASGAYSGSFSFTNAYTRKNDDTLTPAASLGLSWAAFMLGLPSSTSIASTDTYATHNAAYGAYIQDNWRLTNKLSLNLSLRWEYEGGPTERFNRQMGAFDAKAQLPITAGAVAAYAASPVPELSASQFAVLGGSLYSGANGVDRRQWDGQMVWMPRLSFAYELNSKTTLRGGYGMFYDTLNVLNFGPDQSGYSRTTSTNLTNDYGVNWLVGNPGAGISPMSDPFPVRANGTRFDLPVQNALGLMAKTGSGWTYNSFDPDRPRVQRWRLGIQRMLGADMVLDVAYTGTRGSSLPVSVRQDPLPQNYWATGTVRNDALTSNLNLNVTNPFYIGNFASLQQSSPIIYQQMSTLSFFTSKTIVKNKLLRQFPQMNGLYQANYPAGNLHSNGLEIQVQHRFAKGFTANVGYTETRAYDTTQIDNEFAPPVSYPTLTSQPHRLTATGILEFPFGKGRHFLKSGPLSWAFGGWQLGSTYEWEPGQLLQWPNLFYSGDPNNYVNDIKIDSPGIGQWFNTAKFQTNPSMTPTAFHVRVFPRVIDGLRGISLSMLNSNVVREFDLGERKALELRLDVLNLFNHTQWGNPDTTPTDTNFGKLTTMAYEGVINRTYQIQARLRF